MNLVTAFAAVGLTAVLGMEPVAGRGSIACQPCPGLPRTVCRMSDNDMVLLMDAVLALRRERGNKALMLQAAAVLSPAQALTAYAMASELMRSDGPIQPEERRHLDVLALMLSIAQPEAERIDAVFDLLHAPL